MPNYNNTYPMVLNNVFIGMISLRSDQINYFNIPPATEEELKFVKYVGSIAGHTRNIRSRRLDSGSTTRPITVEKTNGISRDRGKIIKGRGGKPFKIPTQLVNTPTSPPNTSGTSTPRRSTPVYTTIRFPGNASIGEVSAWLYAKLTAKKPTTFQSPSGKAYALSPLATGAVVTGDNTTP